MRADERRGVKSVRLPDELAAAWRRRTSEAMERYGLPGVSVSVFQGSTRLWAEGLGLADVPAGVPAGADTIYRLASITKLFTACTIMLLRDEGLLSVEDPVVHHVPEFPNDAVTVRQLLCHGSGMQRETPNDPGFVTGEFRMGDDFRAALTEATFPFQPMARWKYSNLGYNTLGRIVEHLGGRPYERVVEERVIGPLGLSSTRFDPADLPRERLARGYVRVPDRDSVDPDPREWEALPPAAGQLFSTVEDLAVFGGFLAGAVDGPISRETLEEMRRPVIVADEGWTQAHGLGPMLMRDGETILAGHAGGLFGYAGWLLYSPVSRIGAAALTNVGDGDPLYPLVLALIREEAAAIPAEPALPAGPPPPAAEFLLGRYHGDGAVLGIVWERGKLLGRWEAREGLPAGTPFELTEAGPEAWRCEGGPYVGEVAHVDRDTSGRVRGLDVATYRFERL
jgi:CubicO group peptidase (beta-lactamase class C family)